MNLDHIAQIFKRPGPFLTAYVDVRRDTESGEHEVATRWKDLRRRAAADGAPEQLLDAVGERVLTPPHAAGPAARFVVASAEGILLDDVTPGEPHAQFATWSPLPDIGAWLVDRQGRAPVLIVLADHAGAELSLHLPWPDEPVEQTDVEGSTQHLQKVTHPRVSGRFDGAAGLVSGERLRGDIQRSTEETWRKNAREVAAEIDRRAERVEHVVLAGDPRACADVQQALGAEASRRTVVVESGSRAPGAAEQPLTDEVHSIVDESVAVGRALLLEDYERRRGQGGGFAGGIGDVLAACVEGKVAALLLDPDTATAHRLRPDTIDGLTLATGVPMDEEVRADQLTIAASARTGADVHPLTSDSLPSDGVAALLRWDD
jgi:hypothetical protein